MKNQETIKMIHFQIKINQTKMIFNINIMKLYKVLIQFLEVKHHFIQEIILRIFKK
jgi:hypothetical protein